MDNIDIIGSAAIVDRTTGLKFESFLDGPREELEESHICLDFPAPCKNMACPSIKCKLIESAVFSDGAALIVESPQEFKSIFNQNQNLPT